MSVSGHEGNHAFNTEERGLDSLLGMTKHEFPEGEGSSVRRRRHIWHATTIALLLCVSCGRNTQDSEEVIALRAEVKSLREELARQKSAPAPPTVSAQAVISRAASVSPPPEFGEFLRVARRIVSAMGTGVSYSDFGQRLVEVNASAEESLAKVNDRSQKAKITDFVIALHDAHSLWRLKVSSGSDRLRVETISGEYGHPAEFPQELGDRWNTNFPDLVKKYRLGEKGTDEIVAPIRNAIGTGGYKPHLFFDRGLQHIFEYATKTFREIEKTEQ